MLDALLALNNSDLSLPSMLLSSRRTLLQALLVSLLIHAAILLRVVGQPPQLLDAPAAAIKVVVRQESRLAPIKALNTAAAQPVPEPVKPIAPVVRKAVAPAIAAPESSLSVASSPPAASPEARDPGAHAPVSPALSGEGGMPAPAAKPVPVRDGVSADDLRLYRLSLASASKRFKRYPAVARERGWEGSVDLALNGSALLPEPEIVVLRSSGRALLDDQAMTMLTQAVRATALPDGMRGRNFRVQLTIEFSLENDQ